MPEGVPIVAALDGLVRVARGDSQIGGCDPRFAADANYVVLTHVTGWETQYLHFSKVLVTAGQPVKAGQLLGYSGKTGWACGPHLHFKVARAEGQGWNNPSVPARIRGYGDPVVDTLVNAGACTDQSPIMATQVPDTSTPSTAHGASDAPTHSSTARPDSAPQKSMGPVSPPPTGDGVKLALPAPKDKA